MELTLTPAAFTAVHPETRTRHLACLWASVSTERFSQHGSVESERARGIHVSSSRGQRCFPHSLHSPWLETHNRRVTGSPGTASTLLQLS